MKNQLLGSDDYVILTTLYSKVVRSGPLPFNWSLGKANWEKLYRLVDDQFINHAPHGINPEKMNPKITNFLISVVEIYVFRSKNMGKQPLPW